MGVGLRSTGDVRGPAGDPGEGKDPNFCSSPRRTSFSSPGVNWYGEVERHSGYIHWCLDWSDGGYMDQDLIFVTIVGMTVVTYLPRLLPVLLMSSRALPRLLEVWLSYVPSAVLAALVAPSLLVDQHKVSFATGNVFLWASIPTVIVAWKTKNLFLSVFLGMGIVAIVRLFL